MQGWQVDGWTITRVGDPGFELVLPQEESARAALRKAAWLQPWFVTDDWALRVGSSALVVSNGELTVMVDPWSAFDDPGRFGPRMEALGEAGWVAADIDLVVNSHIDGIGANVDPSGAPTFPGARYLVPGAEMVALEQGDRAGTEGFLGLEHAGLLDRVDSPVELAPGLALEPLPGHNLGHYGVFVGEPAGAVVVGHLFLHPAQIANPHVVQGGEDPEVLPATRRALLDRCQREGMTLIGPLFDTPGGGTVHPDGDTWRLDPTNP